MRKFLAPLAVAGLLALPLHPAAAQTNLSWNQQFGPATSVVYNPFQVLVAGNFTLHTSGMNPVDPMIGLFRGASPNGAGLGAALGFNDDGVLPEAFFLGGTWQCLSSPTCHSTFQMFLEAGDYTAVGSVYYLDEAGARAGAGAAGDQIRFSVCSQGDDWSACSYNLALTSDLGTVTPEPATLLLLGTGLAGVFAYRRRKKHTA